LKNGGEIMSMMLYPMNIFLEVLRVGCSGRLGDGL